MATTLWLILKFSVLLYSQEKDAKFKHIIYTCRIAFFCVVDQTVHRGVRLPAVLFRMLSRIVLLVGIRNQKENWLITNSSDGL